MDWNHFTLSQCSGMTLADWTSFAIDETTISFLLDAVDIFLPTSRTEVFHGVQATEIKGKVQ